MLTSNFRYFLDVTSFCHCSLNIFLPFFPIHNVMSTLYTLFLANNIDSYKMDRAKVILRLATQSAELAKNTEKKTVIESCNGRTIRFAIHSIIEQSMKGFRAFLLAFLSIIIFWNEICTI